MIGSIVPTLSVQNSLVGNSSKIPSSSATYATSSSSETASTQKGVVRRSPVDISPGLKKKISRLKQHGFKNINSNFGNNMNIHFNNLNSHSVAPLFHKIQANLGGKIQKSLSLFL